MTQTSASCTSRIGLVVVWTVAKELQFAKDEVGRRCRVRRFDVVMIGHGMRSFAGSAASIAAFVAITQTAGGAGQHPEQRGGPERQRRMAEAGYFASRCKGPKGRRKIAERSHCRPGRPAVRSPSRRPWSRLSSVGPIVTELSGSMAAKRAYSTVADKSRKRETSSGAS